MNTNINYVKDKREKIGKCNICGESKKLSWDHVPPKGAIFYDDVELRSVFNKYVDDCPKIFSQNGTKFRSICSDCNNNLGSKFDIEFNDFIQSLAIKVFDEFPRANSVTVNNSPNKIVRALFGHLLAAKSEYQETNIDKLMRKYISNEEEVDPGINIYCWFYPYNRIEIMRDYAKATLGNSELNDFFSLLKMYPVSFYITENETYPDFMNLRDLCIKSNNSNINIVLDIDIDKLKHHDWPILLDDNSILLGHSGNNPIISRPRTKK